MSTRQVPRPVSHVFCSLLTFCVIVLLLLSLAAGTLSTLMNDRALPERIALSDETLSAQRKQIESAIDALAEKNSFTASAVTGLVTDEALRLYNQDVITWWQGLTDLDELNAPAFTESAVIEAAVIADPLFASSVEKNLQKSVARDKIAIHVLEAIKNAVLPVRTSLITIAFNIAGRKIDVTHYASFLPWICALTLLCAALLMAIILLLTARRLCCGLMYIGSALSASGLLVLLGMLLTSLAHPAEAVAALSPILALQVRQLLAVIGTQYGILAGAAIVTGLALIAVHQVRMAHVLREVRT